MYIHHRKIYYAIVSDKYIRLNLYFVVLVWSYLFTVLLFSDIQQAILITYKKIFLFELTLHINLN